MDVVHAGRKTMMDGGPRNAGYTEMLHASDADHADPLESYRGERELAAAVFRQAFLDMGVQVDGVRGRPAGAEADVEDADYKSAKLFLFDAGWAPMRTHWLALLGLTEEDFRTVLAKESHQGQKNRVLAAIRGRQGDRATRPIHDYYYAPRTMTVQP